MRGTKQIYMRISLVYFVFFTLYVFIVADWCIFITGVLVFFFVFIFFIYRDQSIYIGELGEAGIWSRSLQT